MNYYHLVKLLTEHNCDAPSHEAAELISHFTGKSREWLMLNREAELPDSVAAAAEERIAGKPLQYITGKAWFYGDRYYVTPDVLIPQPDTEHLVEEAIYHLRSGDHLLDLCTGSGCIPISILKNVKITAAAVDISEPALEIARKNAELHSVTDRLRLIRDDVITSDQIKALVADADVITSNPPYIDSDVIPTLSPEVQAEPHIALDGGADGLVFYRRLLELAKFMKPDAIMILELGHDQAARIDAMFEAEGFKSKLRRDFEGHLRVATITR